MLTESRSKGGPLTQNIRYIIITTTNGVVTVSRFEVMLVRKKYSKVYRCISKRRRLRRLVSKIEAKFGTF